MDLAVIFSARKEYTTDDPLKIRLDEGVHEIVGNGKTLNVTCSHITFVGKGKNHTTIRGGFIVENQQNVKFEGLTIMNPCQYGNGLRLRGNETTVDVLKCIFKECTIYGMYMEHGATVTATQCEFTKNGVGVGCEDQNTKARLNDCTVHHNGGDGLLVAGRAVVDFHGIKTDIHSNKRDGIYVSGHAKVNIHLPSQHSTFHDNVRLDRRQKDSGTIANINTDGTFTHVVADDDVEDDY
jgi:hypothetical protein